MGHAADGPGAKLHGPRNPLAAAAHAALSA